MEIRREINGVEFSFALTDNELRRAYEEMEHSYDMDDCKGAIDGLSDEQVMDIYGVTVAEFLSLLDDMASEKRRNMVKYDMDWVSARDEAIGDVIGEYLDEKES